VGVKKRKLSLKGTEIVGLDFPRVLY